MKLDHTEINKPIELPAHVVAKAVEALRNGAENTDEVLDRHDQALGRTTTKNRLRAECYEGEIRDMRKIATVLEASLGID